MTLAGQMPVVACQLADPLMRQAFLPRQAKETRHESLGSIVTLRSSSVGLHRHLRDEPKPRRG